MSYTYNDSVPENGSNLDNRRESSQLSKGDNLSCSVIDHFPVCFKDLIDHILGSSQWVQRVCMILLVTNTSVGVK